MNSFILLHDAFQGGWVWRRVAQALRDKGCVVHAPSLTGCGERSHIRPADNPIPTYLEDIASLFRHEDINDAVLVCNGYSGMLAPTLAGGLGSCVRSIVFLDAALPLPGESYRNLAPSPVIRLLDDSSGMDGLVRLVLWGLPRLLSQHQATDKLVPFPKQAFETVFDGPPPEAWPPSLFVHLKGDRNPFEWAMFERARALGIQTMELDIHAAPVMARHEDIAQGLLTFAPGRPAPSRGGCGGERMPEAMRLLYCPRARLRAEYARGHDHKRGNLP